MKKLVTGLLVLSMLGSTASFAEARDGRRGDRDRDGERREYNDRNWRDNDGDRGRNWRRGDRDRRWDGDRRQHRRWNWSRGQRFDWDRRNYNYYYVDNWNSYHLRRPPRGYRWVRVDNDFLLVALATGIIFEILAHSNDRYDDDRYDDDRYYDDRYYR